MLTAENRMNVLFFAVDDLNNHVGTYGRPVKTPNIDALAASGVRFDRAYCQYPLCNPSRTSLLTGIRPPRTRVLANETWFRQTMPDVVTLPQHFRENGYYTSVSGKVFHDGKNDNKGWVHGPVARGPRWTGPYVEWADRWEATSQEDDLPDARIASEAIERLEKRPQDKPFFVACGFHKPHVPFLAPQQYFDWYDPAAMQLPKTFAGMPAGRGPAYRSNFDLFVNREATPALAQDAIRAYYACTSFTDAQIGRVLGALERLGLRDNTAIVLIADHGWHLGEKGMWSKLTLFEPSTRIPLILSVPKLAQGKGCSRIVESVDVYPTLVDVCGLPKRTGIEGRSLRPLLENPGTRWHQAAYSFLRRRERDPVAWPSGTVVNGASVRNEKFRYTEWDEGKAGSELYDYDEDPTESRNLATDGAHAETVKKMKALLRAG